MNVRAVRKGPINRDWTRGRTMGLCPSPQPQKVASPLHADLLVSADLTADEISATGGHRRFVPARGIVSPWTRHLRNLLEAATKQFPAVAWGYGAECRHCASGPASFGRQPGCFASGESQEKRPGKSSLFPGVFYGFLWARSPQTIVLPTQQAVSCVL